MYPPNPQYPVRLDVEYPDKLSRLLIFVKWLLAIPHLFALFFLGIGAYVVLIISWFAVIITGQYPAGMFNYMVGVMRWGARVQAYIFFMTDAYPPFSMADDPSYPVHLEIDYPPRMPRWRPLIGWLLAIPLFIVTYVLVITIEILTFINFLAILITGRFPEGLFNFVLVSFRWSLRTVTYAYWMTEPYPPFVWA